MTPADEGTTVVLDRADLWRTTGRPTLAVIGVIVSAAIPPFLVGALAPLIGRDIAFGPAQVGVAIAAYYFVSAVLSPLGGRVVDLIGVTRALRLSCGITTVGLLVTASAGSALHITLALSVLGVPNSAVQPAANAVLAEVRTPRLQAVVFGTVQASIPTATLIAGMVLGIASYAGGWRWTVLAVAALTLVALWLTRGLPAATRGSRAHESVDTAPTEAGAGRSTSWVLAMLVATGFLASTAATSLPSFIATTGLTTGLSAGAVATAQVLGSVACACTRIGAPLGVSHGTTQRRLVVISLLLLGGGVGYLLLGGGSSIGFVVGTVVAYAFGWGWNGLFNQVVVSVCPDRIASATGKTQGGVFFGGMLGPLAFAAVVHSSGYGSAWLIAAGAAGAASCTALLAALLWLRQTRAT